MQRIERAREVIVLLGHSVLAAVQFLLGFIVQLLVYPLALLVVPVMLLLGKFDPASETPFTEYPGNWIREVFPKIFWLFDNAEDSSTGDIRGWWHNRCGDSRKFSSRFMWLAVRNPMNNFKRYILGLDIREYKIEVLAGQPYVRDDLQSTGWQFLIARPVRAGIPRYMLYIVLRTHGTHALVVQQGNKLKLSHNGAIYDDPLDYWKGFTNELNPNKDIS